MILPILITVIIAVLTGLAFLSWELHRAPLRDDDRDH